MVCKNASQTEGVGMRLGLIVTPLVSRWQV